MSISSSSSAPSLDSDRFAITLFGATGFTGRLVAEWLAERLADPAARAGAERPRWAIAGRRRDALERFASELGRAYGPPPEVVVADVEDAESLAAMARASRVVATTVGPFERFGEPVARAAVDAGCHYADITGEPAYVARLDDTLDERAREAGVRLVVCCGFDSVPHDLATNLAVRHLNARGPVHAEGYVSGQGELSGGTWRSAIEALADPSRTRDAMRRNPATRGCRDGRPVRHGGGRPHREPRLLTTASRSDPSGSWTLPLPTIDPWIVARSACALDGYGSSFRYRHFLRIGPFWKMAAGTSAVGAIALLARIPPARSLLLKLRPSGDGPDAATRERSRFRVDVFAEGDGRKAHAIVSGGDPGYGETSKMLAESALSLAFDSLPARFGVLTPATAFGDALVDRLRAVGMRFTVGDG